MTEENRRILPADVIPAGTNKRNYKAIALGIASAILLSVSFAFINVAIYSHRELAFWIWPAILMIFGIVFLTLFALVNSNRVLMWVFTVAPMLAYVYLFPKTLYALLAGAIFMAMMVWFEQRIRSEEKVRQHFSVSRITASSVSVIIYAFFFLLGLNIYASTSERFKEDPERFYNRLGYSVVRSARYLSGEDRSGIDFNQSLDEYLATQVAEENPEYTNLSEEQKREVQRVAREEFFKRFSIQPTANQSLAEIMAQIAVEQIKQTSERFESFFPLIFTLVILALLRTFTFLFRWIVVLFTWVVFRLLYICKFFSIRKVQVEIDQLEV